MRRSLHVKTILTIGVVALAVFAGVMATACGDETSSDEASASGEPIKIGVPVAMTGVYAGDGQNSLQGIEMAVSEINDSGGLVGRPVEIVKFDTQDLSPERVALGADTLIQKDKVDAAITGWAGFGGDIQAFGKYDPVPFFHADAQQVCVDVMKKNGYTNIWTACETEQDVANVTWSYIKALPYEWPNKKVAFIHGDDPFGVTVYAIIGKMAKADGWTVVSDDKTPFGTTQWGAILTRVRTKDPALVMFEIMSATDMLTFVDAFTENPTNSLIYLGMGMAIREFQDAAKGKIDGFLGVADIAQGCPFPPQSEAQNEWVTAFTEKFGARPGGLAGITYINTKMWAAAVEAVGDPSDYKAINDWLDKNEVTVWEGVAPYAFDDEHVVRSNDKYFGQMQDGALLALYRCPLSGVPAEAFKDYQGKTYEFQVPSWIK